MENGHVISGCRFTRGMTEAQVEIAIVEAFDGKIPAGVDIEIMMSMHTSLVKPSLAPGQQGIDGAILQRLFQNKPVYIRPSKQIMVSSTKIAPPQEEETLFCSESPHGAQEENPEKPQLIDLNAFPQEEQQGQEKPISSPESDDLDLLMAMAQATEEDGNLTLQNSQLEGPSTSSVEPSSMDVDVLSDASPVASNESSDIAEIKEVLVHRTTIRQDIIDIFMDSNIINYILNVTVINTNGHPEAGKGDGVLRDVLTHFWQEFFTTLSIGGTEKTPHIRHDLQKPQWQSIARAIVYGYKTANYFPLQLSQLFILCCLFGEESINRDFLLKSFRCYVAGDDRQVLDMLLSKDFNPNDEDVLDFLSTWKCYKVPTPENIDSIIFELAHQELIQKPRYITNCWSPILKSLKCGSDSIFQTPTGVAELYEKKRPTAKKVNKLFRAHISNDAERQSMDHLKRYVKLLEGKALERFLHFITGSDVLSCDSVEVIFTSLDGFQRRPVVHTCGPSLELPSTYESFTDLAEEFTSMMRDNISWSFDIV